MGQPAEAWRSVEASPVDPQEPQPASVPRGSLLALGTIATVLAVAAVGLLVSTPPGGVSGDTSTTGTPPAWSDAGPGQSPPTWMVDVGGAVVRPGLYALPPGSRVADAIRAAGGYGARVDAAAAAARLNLAEVLHDGAKVTVPERGVSTGRALPGGAWPGGALPGSAGQGGSGGARIDLNRASAGELDTLPGIGPATAAKIIAAREEQPFRSVDELLQRKVVSASVLAKIRPLVTVEGG